MPNIQAGLEGRTPVRAPAGRPPFRDRTARRACAALLAASLACGGDEPANRAEPAGSGAASVRDSAGVTLRVETDAAWRPGAEWRLERDLVVGAIDGRLAFGRIADVAPRSAGGLWVLDAQAARVRGFDGAGRQTLELGGRGEGPGELRSPSGVVETADGRIAVLESYPPRVSWFAPAGDWLGATGVEPLRDGNGSRIASFAKWAVAPDGTLFAEVFAVPVPGAGPEARHALLRIPGPGREAGPPDTVTSWRVAGPVLDPAGAIPVLPPLPAWTVGAAGSVRWTPGSPYEVRTLSRDGELLEILRRPVAATRLTPELRAKLEAGIRKSLEAGGGGQADAILDRLRFPESLPHVAGLWLSRPDGALYVARYTEGSVREERPTVLDVFAPDGRLLGEMSLPQGFSPRAFTPDAAFGVVEDPLGVPFAARFRIVRPDG